jgi:hypothetical protein
LAIVSAEQRSRHSPEKRSAYRSRRPRFREIRLVSTIICFCIGAVAPIAMVGWVLLR